MSLTAPEAQPAQGQDPQAQPDPTAAAAAAQPVSPQATPTAPPTGAGPWAQDLEALFADPATRSTVDGFLREKVQPYTTRLEQEAAQAKQAMNLWTSFEQSPIDTYVQITEELYGPESAQQVLATLQQTLQAQQGAVPAQPATPQAPPVDEQTQQVMEWAQQRMVQEYYDQELSRLKSDPANQDLVTMTDKDGNPVIDQIHTFVATSGGDFDRAAQELRAFVQRFGVPQQPVTQTPPAPNVMGSDTTGTAPVPTEPRKQTLEEAINDFVRESRTNAAPPVGTV